MMNFSSFDGDDSIVNNKKQTRTVLENFLKTKRPGMAELISRGILSTEGKKRTTKQQNSKTKTNNIP